MKLDKKFPWGECPPYSDYRRLLCYFRDNQFQCVACGDKTNWIVVTTHSAVCSEECVAKLVNQHGHKQTGSAHHWLLEKDVPLGPPVGRGQDE